MQEMLNLKWDSFSSQLTNSLDVCYEKQFFVDLSLVCKNGTIVKCHKMILANASSFFRRLLIKNDHPHPMIILHDIEADDLKTIINFMYCGEIHVVKSEVRRILKVAEILEVSGLKDIRCKLLIPENNFVPSDSSENPGNNNSTSNNSDFKSCARSNTDDETATSSTSSFVTPIPSIGKSCHNFTERVNRSGRGIDVHGKSRPSLTKKYQNVSPATATPTPAQIPPDSYRSIDNTKAHVPYASGTFSKKRLFHDEPITWTKVLSQISKDNVLPLKRLCVMDEVEITASDIISKLPTECTADHYEAPPAASEVDPLDTTGIYIKEEIDADTDDDYYNSRMMTYETAEHPTLCTFIGAKSIDVLRNVSCDDIAVASSSKSILPTDVHGGKDSGT